MNVLAYVIGAGIVSAMLLVIAWYIGETFNYQFTKGKFRQIFQIFFNHTLLKMVFAIFSLGMLASIPLVLYEEENYCSFEVNQTNTTVQGNSNITNYTYAYICQNNPHQPAENFFRNYVRILWFFGIYIMIFIVIVGIEYLIGVAQQLKW